MTGSATAVETPRRLTRGTAVLVPIRFRVDVTRPRDPWDPDAVATAERYARHVLAAACLLVEDRLALEQGLEVSVALVDVGPSCDGVDTNGLAETVVRPAV